MNTNEIKKLYTALRGKGYSTYDLGDENAFETKMSDKNNRKELYDWVSSRGDFRMGDYEKYEERLTSPMQPEGTTTDPIRGISMVPVEQIEQTESVVQPQQEEDEYQPLSFGQKMLLKGMSRNAKNLGVRNNPAQAVIDANKEMRELEGNRQKFMDETQLQEVRQANRQQARDMIADIDSAMESVAPKSDFEGMPLAGPMGATMTAMRSTRGNADYNNYTTAKRSLSDASKIIEEADRHAADGTYGSWLETSFAGNAARGFGDKLFDIRTWDMGISDTMDNANLLQALNDFDEGKALSKSQQALLDAKAVELATQAYFGSYLGRGYKAGQVTAEAIPFMIEMAINPASAMGKSAGNMMARYALKRFGKGAATKALSRGARVAGDIAGASTMAATTGIGRVASDATERMAGQVQFATDEDNRSVFAGHTEGEDPATAVAKAFGATTIENYSEMFGNYFSPILGGAGKMFRKGADKIGAGKVVKMLDDVAASDLARIVSDFEKNAQWSGTISEYAEEVAGGIMNAIFVGDQTLDTAEGTGVFNLDQNIDTFLGVALLGGAMSTVKTVGYPIEKYQANKRVSKADKAGLSAFHNAEAWEAVKEKISVDDIEQRAEALTDIMLDNNMSEEQKVSAFKYVEALQNRDGVRMGEMKHNQDPTVPREQVEVEQSYDNGYTLETSQEMNDAKVQLDAQAENLRSTWGSDADQDIDEILGEDPYALIREVDDEQRGAIIDYLNAKATYDGMIQRVRDDIDSQVEANNTLIDQRKNITTGMVVPATLKQDDKAVFVKSGNVVLNDDGSVNNQESSESIVVMDEAGHTEMIAPSAILTLGQIEEAETLKATQAQQIAEQYATMKGDQIDGILPFVQGDTYNIMDEQGAQYSVQVVADNGDGSVQVAMDGATEAVTMPKEQIQAMSQAFNKARAVAYNEQKKAQEVAQQEPQAEQKAAEGQPEVVESAQKPVIPTLKDGTPDYNAMDADMFTEQYVSQFGEELTEKIARNNIKEADKAIASIQKQIDGITDPNKLPALYAKQQESEAKKAKYTTVIVNLGLSEDASEDNASRVQRMKKEATPRIAQLFPDGLPNVESVVMADIATGNKIRWTNKEVNGTIVSKGLGAELGLADSKAERTRRISMIGKDAPTPEEYAESLRERLDAMGVRYDESELRNQILNVYASVDTPKNAWEWLENMSANMQADQEGLDYEEEQMRRAYERVRAEQPQDVDFEQHEPEIPSQEEYNQIAQEFDQTEETAHVVEGTQGERTDKQGNRVNQDGSLIVDVVNSIEEITDEDFENPKRSIQLPQLPENVNNAIGADGKPVVIKKNIFERNAISHSDLTPDQSRQILKSALYSTKVYGQNQKKRKPYNWVVISVRDEATPNKLVLLEVNEGKENVEIIHWHYIDQRGLEKLKRQAEREDGQLLILPSENSEEVGALADPTLKLPSDSKDTTSEPKNQEVAEKILQAEAETNIEPSEAQKEAGNYKKGHVSIDGLNITIENPKDTERSGVDENGQKWSVKMNNTYGYIRRTEGKDGDHIDLFLSDHIDDWNGNVFVVDQVKPDGSFDEHKVMYGFDTIEEAEQAYMSNYSIGWKGLGAITGTSKGEFKKWLDSSHRKTKPFAEYKAVKKAEGQSVSAERHNLADFKEGDVVRDYYNKKLYRIKKHSKNGVSTIAMLDEEGNEVYTTQMNAHSNSRYNLANAFVKTEIPTISQESEQTAEQPNVQQEIQHLEEIKNYPGADKKAVQKEIDRLKASTTGEPQAIASEAFSIEPAQYTNKRGKILDMHLVKFADTLTKEQQRAAKELAKAEKGWYDREQGGFMMRSEESAKRLADTILNNDDAVSNAQPVSLTDMQSVSNGEVVFTEPQQPKQATEGKNAPVWQYSISVDSDGFTTLRREDISGAVPVVDAFFTKHADEPQEMLDILRNPLNGMQEILDVVGTTLENQIATRELNRKIEAERRRKYEELRQNGVNGFKIGDKVLYTPEGRSRKPIEATIHDFEEFGANNPVLDVGLAPIMYETTEWKNISKDGQAEPLKQGHSDKPISSTQFIKRVQQASNGFLDAKSARRTCVDTIVKGSRGHIDIDLNYIINVAIDAGMTASDAINFFEAEILPRMPWEYVAKYNLFNVENLRGRLRAKDSASLSNQEEQAINPSGNKLVSDERYAELRERMRKKLGGQMNIGIDPEILAIGTEMAVYHLEKGARKFTEYAKAMIADLGDAIRPYLKAFYNGARNLPEVEGGEIATDMTPYDEVQRFNVATFDKEHSDPFTTAEIVVAEQAHQEEAEQAKQEIINQRNTERRNEDEQTSASTEAIASQAETVADKAESDIETATTEEQLNDVVATIDKQIEEVNKQLALLGYYEADIDNSQFHESYGYMRSAEKKAVKDADTLAKRIVKDLGIDPASIVDKKGKRRKVIAQANIAPAGGNVYIHLPLTEDRDLYISVDLEPDYKGGNRDNLFIDHIMLRIENPTGQGYRYVGRNVWVQSDATYTDMLDEIRAEIIQHVPEFDLPTRQSVSETEQKQPKAKKSKKKAVNLQQSGELGLFDSLFDNETNNEDGLQRNDATRSEGVSANGNRHEQGLSRGTETSSESEQQDSRRTDNGGERTGDAVDRTVRPRLSDTVTEQSIEGKRKKEVERNRKLANELKGVTLFVPDTLGVEHELSGFTYYKLENVFHFTDNINGQRNATRKELDAILKIARKNNGKEEISEPKNTRNNHSERGKDHAPTSVDARIEANIKAIELAKQLLESGEQATEKQMQTLRKFSGWGGLGKAFSEGTYYAPNNIAKRLRELLGEAAYQEAVMSANSAYYTPAYVVDTLWDIAEQMGFKGGNILEGSAGIGNILGQMPTHISERSNIHAIEIDGTSGGILSLLYPDAKVEIQGFEETRIANGSVDLAITNVPFVTGLRVNDTTGDKDLSKKFHNIHDFCIAKNVRKLREGGLGIFITSNGTLDNSKKLRDWIVNEGGADFVGAFRMHNKTFGGTGVTSDIIVIRKRVNGKKSANAIDVSTVTGERMAEYDTGETRKVKGQIVPVVKQLSMDYNQYFVEHPENMAGEMHFAFEKGDTFRPTSKGLYPKQDKKQEQMLAEFVQSFTAEEFGEKATDEIEVIDAMPGKKIGEVFVSDGKLYINAIGAAQPLEVNANKVKGHTKVECFEAYSAIKEALAAVLEYQITHEDDKGLKPLLAKLNKAYDDFVATYGHFNKNTAIAFLRNDVDYANVFALEKFEESADAKGNKVQKFGKTDVFSKRVIEKEAEPMPTNVKDGIVASIFKFGRIDIPYIAEQLGKSEAEVKAEIIESGYGFEDPATRQVEVSYQYLSGNVREKLRQAQENNENGEFDRNIKALQEVMPMTIPAHLIDFTLGSSWIEPKLYEEYVKERTDVGVQFTAVGGTWFMNEPYYTAYEKNRAMGVTSEMLGRTVMGHTLIEAAIQNKSITVSTVKKNWDGSTETITDKEATQACSAKIDEIRQDFKEWARQKMQSDAEMSERMERVYNDTFNNYVPMSIPDEFVPEYFGGASHKFKMRSHQGRAIVRGTMQPLLLAHEVGTGKTFTLISTAMEMRRLGTARKPMIVVQNATVGQFVASAKELYPNAKILTLEEADRSADGRKNFYAKIKYNDWDMIVVPQSTFEFIPDSEERQMAFVQEKIEEKMLVLEQMKEADPDGKSMITRQAEREIALLEEELAGLSGETGKKRTANDEKKRAVALQNAEVKAMEMLDRRTDDVENFDDMGIDALLIDEAHEYKHLGFATAMQRGVKGVDPSYSKKSQGVFLKTQAVLEKNNGRNVIFATGTPISNTAAEIWTFMRYLMPADTMKEYGIYYFDDFVRNFGNIQQMLEFTTSGKFKENNRFAGYVNLPELVRIWSGVSDTVPTKEAGGVSDKIPDMEGGKAQDLYLPQTRALRSIMKYVKAELERYDKMSGKAKKENSHIPLTMYGIAKAAAVDARLVQSDAEDDAQSKTNEAVRQTLRSLKESADYKGTVAIFADNYQNKESGFNLYEDIRTKLIAEGIPADEIVVIKSGMTVKKKLEIFEKVNRGEVRVILGSTFTLGTGVNIQERLYTLIHLDAPNRPMDYTQRNGRILRQGNLHKAMGKPVRVLRFGVEDSLDVTAYQRLKTKGAIADSIMNGKQMIANSMTNRVLEEEEDVFGDTVAQLSGSEYAMLKNNAEKNVRKYATRKKQWEADQTYIHNAKPRVKAFIKDAEKRIEDNSRYLDAVRATFPDGKFKEIVIGKHRFATIEAMEDFFKEHNKSLLAEMKQMKDGNIAGEQKRQLAIQIGDFSFVVTTKMTRQTVRDGATLFNDVERKMTYSCAELGIEDIPVRQNLLRNAIEDITNNVITGRDFAERVEIAERVKKHNETELEQLLSREGKPFEYEAELEQAQTQYEEFSELMKKELAEKEAKYAEMDATVEAANDLATAEEADELEREGIGSYTDDELALESDPVSKALGKPRGTRKQRREFAERERQRMVARVENLAKELNLDNVEIVTDASTLEGKKQRAKGFYTKSTGKITIVIPNHSSTFDIEQTLLHEAVAHYGLRQLFGEHFDTFLDNVFNNADESIRQRIVALAAKNGWDFHEATEEYIAELAEQGFEERENRNFFEVVRDLFLDMLHRAKIALGYNISDNDLRYMLWRTYQMQRSKGAMGIAEDMVMQQKLGVGNFRDQRKITRVNAEFNEQLDSITNDNAREVILNVGMPSPLLRAYGVEDKPIRLYGAKLLSKIRKHGYNLSDAKNLPLALQSPIAIFKGSGIGSFAILTELRIGNNNVLATLSVGKGGHDVDFNIITSVYDKRGDSVIRWINSDRMLYVNKEKALNYLSVSVPVTEAQDNQELESATKIVEDFDNSKYRVAKNMPNEQGNNDDIRFRDGSSTPAPKKPKFKPTKLSSEGIATGVRAEYEKLTKTDSYQSREALQDGMLSLRRYQEMATKAHGKTEDDIKDWENAYMAENQLSSRNDAEIRAFDRTQRKELEGAVSTLMKKGFTYEEINDYMMLKHGIERNREMSVRAAISDREGKIDTEKLSKWKEAKQRVSNDSSLDSWEKEQRALDKIAQEEFKADLYERDYSGLTAMHPDAKGKVEDAVEMSYDEVNAFEQKGELVNTNALWKAVRASTMYAMNKMRSSSLISKETMDDIVDMYSYYVPLRGFDETTSDEVYGYMNNEPKAFNAPIRKAKGRATKADAVLPYIVSAAHSAIMQGNRNVFKLRFLNFVEHYPTDLVTKEKMWVEYDKSKDEWIAKFPDLKETDSAEDVARKREEFEAKMKKLSEEHPESVKEVKQSIKVPYRVLPQYLQQHQIIVKRNGVDVVLTVNGSPRLAMAINGIAGKQAIGDKIIGGAVGRGAEKATRYLSGIYTQYSPDFMISNFFRDAIYTNTMVWLKESPQYALKFHQNMAICNPATMVRLFSKLENGTLDMSNELEREFNDFIMNGGETGYAKLASIEELKKDIERTLDPSMLDNALELAKKLSAVNRAVENVARFAAYRTSRQSGRSISRSVNDAKEISVNFNRKGAGDFFYGAKDQTTLGKAVAAGAGIARPFYAFFNAAIQGLANVAKIAKRKPVATGTLGAGLFILGALLASMAGDDEEEYYNLPEYVRRQNIVFKLSDGTWASIPLPIEYRAIYGLGEMIVSVVRGKEDFSDHGLAYKVAEQLAQVLPINVLEGKGGLGTLAPTLAAPVVEVLANEDWAGIPIYREDNPFTNQHTIPEYQRVYSNTGKGYVAMSKFFNDITGGDEAKKGWADKFEVFGVPIGNNPAIAEHLVDGYLGGPAQFLNKVASSAEMVAGAKEFDWRSVPFANRLVKTSNPNTRNKAINKLYFNNVEEAEDLASVEKRYSKIVNNEEETPEKRAEYAEKLDKLHESEEWKKAEQFLKLCKEVDNMRKVEGVPEEYISNLKAEANEIYK